jgi:diguanylate cyclase (GGDEF)-like protein
MALWLWPLVLGLLGPGAAAQVRPPADAAITAPTPQSLASRLEAIERAGEAEEEAALRQLQALRLQARPLGEEAVTIPFLAGQIHARRKDAAGVQSARTELAALRGSSAPQQAQVAEVAHALLDVSQALAGADYAAAMRAVKALVNPNLEALSPLWRLRWAGAQATALEEDGRLDEAMLLRLQAVKLAEQTQRGWRKGHALLVLGYLHLRRGDTARALETTEQGVALVKQEPTDADLANAYNYLSIVYSTEGQIERARDILLQGLAYAQRGEKRQLNLLTGNLADLYLRLRDYPRALSTAETALQLARQSADRSAETLALHNSGVAKIALKRVAEGKADVLRAIEMDRASGSITYVSESYLELGGYLERAGDIAGAVKAFHAYRDIADTLERDDRRKAVLEAQQQFDDTLKQAQAAALVQENELQAAQIEARRLQMVLWALLLASGALAAVLLAALTRRTRAANQALALSNADLADQSERDPLTGVGNRNQWQRLLRTQVAGAFDGQLLLVDVDHFKRINDRYGHAGGDQVLVELARRLRAAVRESDAVIRWGGEEFLIYTVRNDDAAAVEALAERVLSDVGSRPVQLDDGRSVPVSVSLGYARFPLDNDSPVPWPWEAALELVDQLMYRAKSLGRNQGWGLLGTQATDTASVQAQLQEPDAAMARGELRLGRLRGPLVEATASVMPDHA